MKIEETPNDVLAVKSLDNQLRPSSNLHPDLLQPPFSLLLVGSAGSGKSTTILRLIYGNKRCKGADKSNTHHKFYRHHFDKIYVFSPTWELDPKTQRCKIPSDQIFDDPELYEETISEILKGQQEDIEAEGKEEADDILMIFSDLAGTKLFSQKKGIMNKLAFNRRHFNISLIIDTQSLRQINNAFRENLSGIMLYAGISNKKELAKIHEEYLGRYSTQQAQEILDYVFKGSQFNFLFINFQKRGKMYKNFNPLSIKAD
jgi:GTPase SAR1 family protein